MLCKATGNQQSTTSKGNQSTKHSVQREIGCGFRKFSSSRLLIPTSGIINFPTTFGRRRASFAAAFAVASLAVVLLVTLSALRAPSNALRAPSGPLPSTLHADSAPTQVALSDGSSILLEATARLDVLGNDERTFVTTLRRGKATFDVKPGDKLFLPPEQRVKIW